MKTRLTVRNCFWLLVPILVWNIALSSRFTQEAITSDANSPLWLFGVENVLRMGTFILPFLLPMRWDGRWGRFGLALYGSGTLAYFASWLPLMLATESLWSRSVPGLLAPRVLPWIALLGIAAIGRSWIYALVATAFAAFHLWHGVQNICTG
jgi:hypothetical protein